MAKNSQWREEDGAFLMNPRGLADPASSSDNRCGFDCQRCQFHCTVRPWIALGSKNCWGDDLLTPDGLADGDLADPRNHYRPGAEPMCDIQGRVMDTARFWNDSLSFDLDEDDEEPNWPEQIEPPYEAPYLLRDELAPFIQREICEEDDPVDTLSDFVLQHPLDSLPPKIENGHHYDPVKKQKVFKGRRGKDRLSVRFFVTE